MELIALIVAAAALIVALAAMARAGAGSSHLEETARSAQRQAASAAEESEAGLANLRSVVAALAGGEQLTPQMVMDGQLWRDVSPPDGAKMVEAAEVRLIDVRTPQETSMGIIPGATLIPVDELETRLREVPKDGKATLIYCAGGGRSAAACEFLSSKGYTGMMNLTGGFGSWQGPRAKPS